MTIRVTASVMELSESDVVRGRVSTRLTLSVMEPRDCATVRV